MSSHKKHTPQQHLRYSSPTKAEPRRTEPSIYCTHHGTGTARHTHRETERSDCIQQTWCIVPVGERTWALASCGSCWTCGPASWGWGWGRAARPPTTSRWWAASPWCSAAALGSPWSGCRRVPASAARGRSLPACHTHTERSLTHVSGFIVTNVLPSSGGKKKWWKPTVSIKWLFLWMDPFKLDCLTT